MEQEIHTTSADLTIKIDFINTMMEVSGKFKGNEKLAHHAAKILRKVIFAHKERSLSENEGFITTTIEYLTGKIGNNRVTHYAFSNGVCERFGITPSDTPEVVKRAEGSERKELIITLRERELSFVSFTKDCLKLAELAADLWLDFVYLNSNSNFNPRKDSNQHKLNFESQLQAFTNVDGRTLTTHLVHKAAGRLGLIQNEKLNVKIDFRSKSMDISGEFHHDEKMSRLAATILKIVMFGHNDMNQEETDEFYAKNIEYFMHKLKSGYRATYVFHHAALTRFNIPMTSEQSMDQIISEKFNPNGGRQDITIRINEDGTMAFESFIRDNIYLAYIGAAIWEAIEIDLGIYDHACNKEAYICGLVEKFATGSRATINPSFEHYSKMTTATPRIKCAD